MKTMVHSVVIDRPVEEVWNYFVEWDNIPKWYPGIREIRPLTEGPLGLGSALRMSPGIGPLKFSVVIRVIEFEPYRLIVFGVRTKTTTRFIFERVGSGTRFTKSQDRQWYMRPFDPLVTRLRDRFNANLKRLMEEPSKTT
jgi:uncharacterized protein YndB with AHSA1/START domain